MPLFHITDIDRPLFVVSKSLSSAVSAWKKVVADENNMKILQVNDPMAVKILCDDHEILINFAGDQYLMEEKNNTST